MAEEPMGAPPPPQFIMTVDDSNHLSGLAAWLTWPRILTNSIFTGYNGLTSTCSNTTSMLCKSKGRATYTLFWETSPAP
jgi:hypothetical protein